jgi:WD40 repeat protein
MSTGELSTEGLNSYDEDCVYDNLKYFMIPHEYSKVSTIENLKLIVYLQLKDGRLCGCTADHSVCIYNMDRNIVETTMKGHTSFICAIIQLEDGRICSSSSEIIKLWSLKSGQCVLSINGHNSACGLLLIDGSLCSGSGDGTIRIWSKDYGVSELSIRSGYHIYCLAQLKNGSICTGHGHGTINLWNIATGVCEMTLNGHTDGVWAIVVIDELRICSCSEDTTVRVWNISTGASERTLEGHADGVMGMILLFDGRICSVSADSSVKIWNKDTGVCELSVHISPSYLLEVVQLQNGQLVVSDNSSNVFIIR